MTGMIECPTSHPGLPALFNPFVPNNPSLWAVFLERQAGRALVDSLTNPTQCLLRTEARLTYASYRVSQSFLADAIDYFRHIGIVWLIRSLGDPPAPGGYRSNPRLEFFDYDPQSPILADYRKRLPASFEVRAIDRNLLDALRVAR